jgi:methylenetetrahydrofolate--tRNA-(uracil-5-)-methyltransferase
MKATVVGGGFAGVEAAWAMAQRGVSVQLYEMRPVKMTPAHKTELLCELVCSNSFKSMMTESPAGLLKGEMRGLDSIVIPTAEECSVPAGQALAVDRDLYAAKITELISAHENIELVREEFTPEMAEKLLAEGVPVVIATGPLTSEGLGQWLAEKTGQEHLYFYDAVSPTVDASTINHDIVFAQSRYDKGEGDDYLNCPFNKEEYELFIDALVEAERVPLKDFEKPKYFEGCKPIEEIASKGRDSLRFGNFKPVGLTDPRTERRPWAAVQLRPENREMTLYSLVACQNRLKWGVQKEVLQMIPGLENADFVRLGVIHRNTYINSPTVLNGTLEFNDTPGLYVAGQITGVEGYIDSASMGLYAGICIAAKLQGREIPQPPRETAFGSLLSHLSDAETDRDFAPMNINWGILPNPEPHIKNKGERKTAKVEAAQKAFAEWCAQVQP